MRRQTGPLVSICESFVVYSCSQCVKEAAVRLNAGVQQLCLGSAMCCSARGRRKRAKRAAQLVTGNYSYETRSITGILR